MIKSNEIRVGNLFNPITRNTELHLPATLVFIKIIEIKEFSVTVIQYHQYPATTEYLIEKRFQDLSPIHLTPEILEKCGFSCNFGTWYKTIEKEEEKHVLEFRRKEGWCIDEIELCNEPEYLHQLQNLYFALTGEELEFNESVNR